MAITVGEKLSLEQLLAKNATDRSNYVERLEVREYRALLIELDAALTGVEIYKRQLTRLKEDVEAVVHANRQL